MIRPSRRHQRIDTSTDSPVKCVNTVVPRPRGRRKEKRLASPHQQPATCRHAKLRAPTCAHVQNWSLVNRALRPVQNTAIQPQDGGSDVFVHISAVEQAGLKTLNDGQSISFDLEQGQGRTSATNLKVS
jgi:cold shock protein